MSARVRLVCLTGRRASDTAATVCVLCLEPALDHEGCPPWVRRVYRPCPVCGAVVRNPDPRLYGRIDLSWPSLPCGACAAP